MENFKQICPLDVWPHLQAGKKVYAVVLRSRKWCAGIKEIWHKDYNVTDINELLSDKEKDVVFYEEVDD